jgi:hypothetical protein
MFGGLSLALLTLAAFRIFALFHAGVGVWCSQSPGVPDGALPLAGWTTEGEVSLFPIGVRCSYFTLQHSLVLVHITADAWDWAITIAAIAGLLGSVLFLTARAATHRIWHALPVTERSEGS